MKNEKSLMTQLNDSTRMMMEIMPSYANIMFTKYRELIKAGFDEEQALKIVMETGTKTFEGPTNAE